MELIENPATEARSVDVVWSEFDAEICEGTRVGLSLLGERVTPRPPTAAERIASAAAPALTWASFGAMIGSWGFLFALLAAGCGPTTTASPNAGRFVREDAGAAIILRDTLTGECFAVFGTMSYWGVSLGRVPCGEAP